MAAEKKSAEQISNVLVFLPPQICFQKPHKKAKIQNKEAHGHWDKTEFHFDGEKFVKTEQIGQRHFVHKDVSSGASEDSCIVLEYDPQLVQESVNSYLDQMFSEPSPLPIQDSCLGGTISTDEKLSERLSELQKEYEIINHESQVLLDSILDKQGNNTKTGEIAQRKAQEARTSRLHNDDTHPMTEDDVYTQQSPNLEAKSFVGNRNDDAKSSSSLSTSNARASTSLPTAQSLQSSSASDSSKDPALKPSNTVPSLQSSSSSSSDSSKDQTLNPSTAIHQDQKQTPLPTCALPKLSNKLSNLADCSKTKGLVNLCVLVLQVNPVKEIQIKSGRNAGQFVPLSSIIVSDTKKSHFKLTLWRQASAWTEKIVAGDIIVATSIRIETWRDEYIGQTTFNSSFYNLHQPQKPLSNAWLQVVSQDYLDKLMNWARRVYGYLFRRTTTTAAVRYCRISGLQNNTLVHFRGVLKSVCVLTDRSTKNTYKFGSRRLPKITAVFAQTPEEEVCVTLWGRQSEWLHSLRKSEGSVWELQYLTAKHDNSSGNMVLHTTSKSTKTKLDADNELAKPLLCLFNDVPVNINTFRTIKELLEAKFSGAAEIIGNIHSISFQADENEVLEVPNCHDVEALGDWCHRLTFVGCASCSRALKQDTNKIYGQCTYCVYHKPGYSYAVKRYFRNITIRVKDKDKTIEVVVSQKSVCKLLKGVEAHNFCPESTCDTGSPRVRDFINVVRDLLSCDKLCRFILTCHTVVDENSFVISRTFELLDFKRR